MKILCDFYFLKIRDHMEKRSLVCLFPPPPDSTFFSGKSCSISRSCMVSWIFFLITVLSEKKSGVPSKLCKFVPLPCFLLLNHHLSKSSFQLHFYIFFISLSSSLLYFHFHSFWTTSITYSKRRNKKT